MEKASFFTAYEKPLPPSLQVPGPLDLTSLLRNYPTMFGRPLNIIFVDDIVLLCR